MTMDSDSAEKEVDKNARKGIIRKIAQCKASLTKAENFIRTLESPINKDVVSARLQQLQEVLPRHEQLLIELSTLDDTLDEDYFENDAFEDRYLAIVASLRGLLAPQPPSPAPASGAQQSTDACATSVRLPEIDIPAFDGKDYTKYHSFIELFSAVIDNNSKLAAIQKLFYLRKYLKGEPLSLIEGLPVTGDSYGKALELLRNRYDNKFLIITNHVQELLDFNPLVKGAATNLRELVSHARQHLGALKTLGQPTDSWDMIVLPILLRKVDQFTCRAYHSERDTTKLPLLDDFFAFVERRASSFEESQRSEGKSNNNNNTYKTKVSNYASKTATKSWSCKYCSEQTHRLFKCDKFLAISPEERLNFISQNNLCKICFNSHTNKCKFHFKCEQCKDKSHNTLLHCNEKVSMHSNSNVSTILLPTIKAKVLCRDGKSHKVVRGLVDSGSQVSFMTADLAKALQLPLIDSNLNITALGKQNKTTSKAVNAEFVSLQNNYKCQVNCSIVDQITTKLPQQQVSWQNIQLPDSVVLADSDFDTPGDISFLLSADIFFQILLPRKIKLQNSNLYLIDTQFGSILSGEVNNSEFCASSHHVTLHAICDNNVDHLLQKFWETEMVPETKLEVTAKQDACEAEFKSSVQLTSEFQVSLPLKVPVDQLDLGNTFPIASKTLNAIEKRLAKDDQLNRNYNDFMNQYIEMGHAKVIPLCQSNLKNAYFMQHLPVIRNDKKTNKVRVVFNGNTKASSQHQSLNDVLLNGPKVQKDLFDILILFRSFKYVMLTDIRHMYRAIKIDPSFRHLQNILWKDENNQRIILQLQTVTYGLKSSSYLATRCLQELADRFGSNMPLAAEVIRTAMYVDDALFGAQTIDEALEASGFLKVVCGFLLLMDSPRLLLSRLLASPEEGLEHAPLHYVALALLAAGLAVCAAAALGCWATYMPSYVILTIYFLIVLALLLCECAGGVAAAVWPRCLGLQTARGGAVGALQAYYALPDYEEFTAAVDLAQTYLRCCGMTDARNYDMSVWQLRRLGPRGLSVPPSCCVQRARDASYLNPAPVNQSRCQELQPNPEFRYVPGCYSRLEDWYQKQYLVFMLGLFVIALVKLGILLSTVYSCVRLRKRRQDIRAFVMKSIDNKTNENIYDAKMSSMHDEPITAKYIQPNNFYSPRVRNPRIFHSKPNEMI